MIEQLSHQIARGQVRAAEAFVDAATREAATGSGNRLRSKNPEEELAAHLGVSKAEIRRRLSVAEGLRDRLDEYGESLGAKLPLVADVFMNGNMSLLAASTMVREISKAETIASATEGVDADATREGMEAALVGANRTGGCPLVSTVAKNWLNRLNTNNVTATDELKRQFQGLHLLGRKYGLNHGEFYFDDEQWAVIAAGSTFEANPRVKTTASTDASTSDANEVEAAGSCLDANGDVHEVPVVLKDSRTRAQKLADGLVRSVRAGLESKKLPVNGGLRPQVMVAIDLETLQGRVAADEKYLSHSAQLGPVDPSMIRKIACDAQILPVVLNGEGRVLDVGEPQRLFTQEQRKILYARDLGCTAPGCTVPADGCEAHHVKEWSQGGPTTIDNGALVCHYHHQLVHETDWRINISSGVPYWVPPKAVDPNQIPLRNHYFRHGLTP
ncbi:hypothetical protein HD598_002052 [Neomicrococcus aestuarii]|uniref:HNH nuclease domain-containing protein n=1 Tax=Neomicrococcus aestuarii TaxID=556325 RepID=A0A7W8X0F4_9MICC|nr:HNH endonuclease signature motif containing protein [Neomicrococcus aestuarii]MBB5513365.1 hypothetical protein [Neomicrococcus aestuarii]